MSNIARSPFSGKMKSSIGTNDVFTFNKSETTKEIKPISEIKEPKIKKSTQKIELQPDKDQKINHEQKHIFQQKSSMKDSIVQNQKIHNIVRNVKKECIFNNSNSSSTSQLGNNSKQSYNQYPTNIYTYSSTDTHECHYCRHSYEGDGVGIPTKRVNIGKNNVASMVIYENLVKDKIPECKTLYIVKDCFCSFECAYKTLVQDYYHTDKQYEDIIGYFMELYNAVYPDEVIKPAGDYRLTKKYGGNMTIEEFRQHGHKYKKINQITCIPEMTCYRYEL